MQAQEEKETEAVEQVQFVEAPPGAYAAFLVSLGVGIASIVVISLMVLFGVYP